MRQHMFLLHRECLMHGNCYNLQRPMIIQRMNIYPCLERSTEAQEEATRYILVLFGSQKVTNSGLQFTFCRSTNSPRRHKAVAEPVSVPPFPGTSFSFLTPALCVCDELCNEGYGFCKISSLPRPEETRHGFSPFMGFWLRLLDCILLWSSPSAFVLTLSCQPQHLASMRRHQSYKLSQLCKPIPGNKFIHTHTHLLVLLL